MKKIIIAVVLLVSSMTMVAQNQFDKFESMKGVSSMVMNQKMFKLLSKVDLNSSDPEMQAYIDLVNNLENVKMFTTTKENLASQMNSTMNNYISSSNLEELLRATDDGKNVKFYYKPGSNDDYVKEFVMFLNGDIDGEDRTVFFQVTGNIDLKQISKLAQELNFKGSEALKDVDKAKKG
ncbi:hypothetical protein GCM10011344_09760 [Dokdonia pacifica]|uniref:DUF4252 domain-containing protein n=1 Tax=Dokdonia pacifica TaxID=1627892 RepID=A0A238YPF6_9FLAO|nr:DUF4252 domain-containing protein [Dokdonia pacifica]GGG11095.1 hypothetical protein GCM10011344_09760 [Dokdonia pacifica]SNR72581.1 protein of unknown function [Dokdonia pacifica]